MRCLFPLVVLAVVPLVRGAEVALDPPVNNSTNVALNVKAKNDDPGVVYDTMEYPLYGALALQLFGQAGNAANHASALQLMDDWTLGVSGQVDNGWLASIEGGLTVRTTHVSGIPGINYDVMSEGKSQRAIALVPASQLELNGVAGYQPFTLAEVSLASWSASAYDAIIVRSDSALLSAPNYLGAHHAGPIEVVFVGETTGTFTYPAPGLQYVLLEPMEFVEWTEFGEEHGELLAGEDANGNGRSNYLDYASGQDPEGAVLLPIVELEGRTLTLRGRVDGIDAVAVAEYSDDLDEWFPLEEGGTTRRWATR